METTDSLTDSVSSLSSSPYSSSSSCSSFESTVSESTDGDSYSQDDSSGSSGDDTSESSTSTLSDDPEPDLANRFHQPLYDGAPLTLLESYYQLMQFCLQHSLTKRAFSGLLNLVNLHLPVPYAVSVYKLRKFFMNLYHDITFTKHYCCSSCHALLKRMMLPHAQIVVMAQRSNSSQCL